MAKIDDCDFVYPCFGVIEPGTYVHESGMTKRERFAMEFMREIVGDPSMRNAKMAANWSVARADALLDELARTRESRR